LLSYLPRWNALSIDEELLFTFQQSYTDQGRILHAIYEINDSVLSQLEPKKSNSTIDDHRKVTKFLSVMQEDPTCWLMKDFPAEFGVALSTDCRAVGNFRKMGQIPMARKGHYQTHREYREHLAASGYPSPPPTLQLLHVTHMTQAAFLQAAESSFKDRVTLFIQEVECIEQG